MLPTIDWDDGDVVMIDQRKLPAREVYVRCRTAKDVAKAIRTMVIRGAPAIGVAAAMGLALAMRRSTATGTTQLATEFYRACDMLAATRPTAVNLFWALERMKRVFAAAMLAGQSTDELTATIKKVLPKLDVKIVPGTPPLSRYIPLDVSAAEEYLGWTPAFEMEAAFEDYAADLKSEMG